jgi:hypothetical protein
VDTVCHDGPFDEEVAQVTTTDHGGGSGSTGSTGLLQVRLNARLPSVQRGDRYEDPLAFWLEGHFPGSRVTGGGTLRSPQGEPLSCGIDADVVGDLDALLAGVVEFLEAHGAPHGSTAALVDGATVEFGTHDGLALYLDGTGLAPEVYAAYDINEFFDRLHEAISGSGALQAFWEGPESTAIYMYGPSADAMRTAVDALLVTHPLAEGSTLVQIA